MAEFKAWQEEEAAEKGQRKTSRLNKKAAKEKLELEWKRVCAEHEAAVLDWKSCCDMLLAEGVAKKNLPVKLKWVLNSSLVPEQQEEADEEDINDNDEQQDIGDKDSHGWEM